MNETLSPDDAQIFERGSTKISPWVSLEQVKVLMPGRSEADVYHGVRVADSVSILAMTPDGRIPIVRQFRPVVGVATWELPSGFRDPGESPEIAGARELNEETGFGAARIVKLVETFELPARLTSRFAALFVLTTGDLGAAEPGMNVTLVDGAELKQLACTGELALPANIACLYLAGVNSDVRAICAQHGFATPPWL